jgi:hypothetical protein
MDSVKHKYLLFLPIYFSMGSLLQNIWSLAVITTVGLILMCLYSKDYKYLRSKINHFDYYLWGTWLIVFLISIAKYNNQFDTSPVYIALAIVIVFLIYFLNKMSKVIDAMNE